MIVRLKNGIFKVDAIMKESNTTLNIYYLNYKQVFTMEFNNEEEVDNKLDELVMEFNKGNIVELNKE